jgi:hypothetical protein
MIRQNPAERPGSIAAVKQLIQLYRAEAVTLQRLSAINATVVKVGEVDEPLAYKPPKLVGAQWDRGTLTLSLDRPVNSKWVQALENMGNYSSMLGRGPETFRFTGETAAVAAQEHEAQGIIDHFKVWLPRATETLKYQLETDSRHEEQRQREQLMRERQEQERRLRVNSSLRI